MKIKFVVDYRGRLTSERFYQAGDEIEVDDNIGAELVKAGRAEEVATRPTTKTKRASRKS